MERILQGHFHRDSAGFPLPACPQPYIILIIAARICDINTGQHFGFRVPGSFACIY